jgi:HK97 family phage portal protein
MRTNLLDRALNVIGLERRAYNAKDPSWNHPLLAGGTTPARAESLSTVYACVSAISETIASLPLILYKRTPDDGRERAPEHPLYSVLHDQPNELQTALEFREMMQAITLLRGNAHAEIIRGSDGQVIELRPILPGSISTLQLDNGNIAYDVSDAKGGVRRLLRHEVFHLRHRSSNGLTGVSPITASRQTVELGLSERDYGNSVFENGTSLSGVLSYEGSLSPELREQIAEGWNGRYSGVRKAGSVAILEGKKWEFKPISMSMEDAQWIEARQFSVEEIARLFRVPPTIIGDLRHGNYSNSVEMNRVFVVHTLRRHMTMWEQAISSSLLTPASRQVYFAEHSVEGLLRGDSANRAEFYSKGIGDGWLTVDEVRKYENLPKLTDAERNSMARKTDENHGNPTP